MRSAIRGTGRWWGCLSDERRLRFDGRSPREYLRVQMSSIVRPAQVERKVHERLPDYRIGCDVRPPGTWKPMTKRTKLAIVLAVILAGAMSSGAIQARGSGGGHGGGGHGGGHGHGSGGHGAGHGAGQGPGHSAGQSGSSPRTFHGGGSPGSGHSQRQTCPPNSDAKDCVKVSEPARP